MRKTWSVGDKLIFKPTRYSDASQQPWEIKEVVDNIRKGLIISHGMFSRRFVRAKSPYLIPIDQATPLQDQLDFHKARLRKAIKTWENLIIGEYYRRWTRDGFVYYKIMEKLPPDLGLGASPDKEYYQTKYLYRKPWYDPTRVEKGTAWTQKPAERVWGRNVKLVPKLEGLMAMGV